MLLAADWITMGRHTTRGGHRYYSPRGGGYGAGPPGPPVDWGAEGERLGRWIVDRIPIVLFGLGFSVLITLAKSCGGPVDPPPDVDAEPICVSPEAVPEHYDPEWYLTHTTSC